MSILAPSNWRDVSLVRQVPDFQEVFQCIDSIDADNVYSDAVLVIEILERQDHIINQDAAPYFLHDLIESEDRTKETQDETGTMVTILYHKIWDVGHDPQTSISNKYDDDDNLIPRLSRRVTACSCVGKHKERTKTNRTSLIPLEQYGHGTTSSGETVIELCVVRLESIRTDLLITLTCTNLSEELITSFGDGHSTLFLQILKSFSISDYSIFSC